MKFIELPLPVDDRTPEGFKLVVAYANGSKVFLPINEMPENEEHHDCDWEGCGSLDHVFSFDVLDKYKESKKNTDMKFSIRETLKNVKYNIDGTITNFSIGLFATGLYMNKCSCCGIEYQGDKRSLNCFKCAILNLLKD